MGGSVCTHRFLDQANAKCRRKFPTKMLVTATAMSARGCRMYIDHLDQTSAWRQTVASGTESR